MIVVLFITSALGFCARAQESIVHQLDSFYTSEYGLGKLMGNVLIIQDDSVIYKKSFGYQDIERNIPNSDSSAFGMASVTKIFTATAILQLHEKKLLGLDDDYVKYFPDFPFPDITIRQLLSHTSGLPAYELFLDSLTGALPEKIFGNEDVIPALKVWHKPLHNAPGEGWHYSSMNYCLLALLVEKLSGMPLNDYFSKYIFGPAGMQHSYSANYLTRRDNPQRTINYAPVSSLSPGLKDVNKIPREKAIVYNCGGFTGQGGLVTTIADMAGFDKAYFSGKLISYASMDEAMTPVLLKNGRPAISGTLLGKGFAGYGLGWFVGIHPMLGRVVWHTGGRPGIMAIYVHDIPNNQAVLILENEQNKGKIDVMAANSLYMTNRLFVTDALPAEDGR